MPDQDPLTLLAFLRVIGEATLGSVLMFWVSWVLCYLLMRWLGVQDDE